MWVKICANTNAEDALLAAALGADAVGFVFAPSRRQVTAEQAAAITRGLPPGIERVGVFTTRDAREIASTVRRAALTGVQLHGEFDEALLRQLVGELGPGIELIQTISIRVGGSAAGASRGLREQLSRACEAPEIGRVLLDSEVGGASGGTGISFGWREAVPALAEHGGGIRLIVAGGLRPDNVAEATETLEPWGVDVASGVEASAGKKDPQKLKAFLRNAGKASNNSV